MDVLITLVVGVVIGSAVTFFVARNNRKKFNKVMDLNPKAEWNEMINVLKARIK